MTRLPRYDFAFAFEIDADADVPAEPRLDAPARAVWTRDGYLLVDAYIARSGTLPYSDGRDRWIEYRPLAELQAAAASWALTPVTDDHPPRMVSPDTWASVAKGVHVGEPIVEVHDGVGYLRARLLVTDAATLKKIRDGLRECSIGFTTAVIRTNGTAPDGTRCDAVQTALEGNHTALVARGRAGPSVRLLMDGAAALVEQEHDDMKTNPKKRSDNLGSPTDMVEVIGPDGQTVQLPTWVAAILEEHAALKAQAAAAAAAAAPASAAPVDAASGGAPPKPDDDDDRDRDDDDDDDDDDEKKTLDAEGVRRAIRKRARLERLAARVGIDEAKIDAADDDALARAFVMAKIPTAKIDAVKGKALDALVETAASIPDAPAQRSPWDAPSRRADVDESDDVEIEFLKAQGYA